MVAGELLYGTAVILTWACFGWGVLLWSYDVRSMPEVLKLAREAHPAADAFPTAFALGTALDIVVRSLLWPLVLGFAIVHRLRRRWR